MKQKGEIIWGFTFTVYTIPVVTVGVVSVIGGVVTEGVTSGVVCDVTEGVGVVTIKMCSY